MTQLASVSKVATASFADGYKTTSGGTLTIKQGADDAGVTVNVAAGATLAEVRDSLNAQLKDKGITANIVNNPGDGTSRLVFTGKDSGAGKDVFVQGSSGLENFNIGSVGADGKLTLSQLDGTSSSSSGYITQAKNAKFSIDGLTLESPTNTVDKVINGVTFEPEDGHRHQQADHHLGRAGPWRRQDNIKKFVEAYNKLVGVTSELTGVTKVGDDKAPWSVPWSVTAACATCSPPCATRWSSRGKVPMFACSPTWVSPPRKTAPWRSTTRNSTRF